MKFYYTVAAQEGVLQPKPSLSLGGYKSSSPVPNNVLCNLFSDISMYTVKSNTANSYIALMLVNDEDEDAYNINIWFKYSETCGVSDAASIFRVAAVSLNTDDGGQYMEHIPNMNSKPLYAEFSEPNGEVNRVDIGNLKVGEMVGLWIERELDLEKIKSDQNAIYEADPANPYHYLEVELEKEDLIELGISWDLV